MNTHIIDLSGFIVNFLNHQVFFNDGNLLNFQIIFWGTFFAKNFGNCLLFSLTFTEGRPAMKCLLILIYVVIIAAVVRSYLELREDLRNGRSL